MTDFLYFIGFIAIVVAIGFTIEHFRNRRIRAWAHANGGTFHSGTSPIPEAEIFDGQGDLDKSYSRISRFVHGQTTFITARQSRSWQGTKGEHKSSHNCVCFIIAPDLDLPPLSVSLKGPAQPAIMRRVIRLAGFPDRPASLPVPDALPQFDEQFEARPLDPAQPIEPYDIQRLLPPSVQQALLADPGLIAGLESNGSTVRLRAIEQQVRHPYPQLLTLADCLVTLWRNS